MKEIRRWNMSNPSKRFSCGHLIKEKYMLYFKTGIKNIFRTYAKYLERYKRRRVVRIIYTKKRI